MTTRQPLQDFSQSYQPVAEWNKELPNQTWGISHPTHEQHQYPLQLHHPKSQHNSVSQQQYMTSQPHSPQPCSMSLQQPLQHQRQHSMQRSHQDMLSPHSLAHHSLIQRLDSIQQHRLYHSTLSSFNSHVPQGQDSVFTDSKGDQRNYAPIVIVVVAVSTFQQAAEPDVQDFKVERL